MKRMTRPEFNKAMHLAIVGTANDLVNELVKAAPVDKGYLKNSIRYEVDGKKINIHMPEYAFFIEFGTKPHTIRAINAKALHWKDAAGNDVFAKIVHHPGTEPYPFIRSTINSKLRDILYENLRRQLT